MNNPDFNIYFHPTNPKKWSSEVFKSDRNNMPRTKYSSSFLTGRVTAPEFRYHTKTLEGLKTPYARPVPHPLVDPKAMEGKRFCNDTKTLTKTFPVYLGFDVTGSCATVPVATLSRLDTMMDAIHTANYADEQIGFSISAIGNHERDLMPFQSTPFAFGNEVSSYIKQLYLEGGGHDWDTNELAESYNLALFQAAKLIDFDSYTERNKKGLMIIIGDDCSHKDLSPLLINKIFDRNETQGYTFQQLINLVQEKWNLFYVLPGGTQGCWDPRVRGFWRAVLENNFIELQHSNAIPELIAGLVALHNGYKTRTEIRTILTTVHTETKRAEAIITALSKHLGT
jgi:hypothetical protein